MGQKYTPFGTPLAVWRGDGDDGVHDTEHMECTAC